MAPTIRKVSSTKARTKLPKSVRPASQSVLTRTATAPQDVNASHEDDSLSLDSTLPNSKRDKRHIKHALLLSRLKGSRTGASANRIQKKRANERENKRKRTHLSSRLGELADALREDQVRASRAKSASSKDQSEVAGSRGLKTKPGHTKRLQKLKEMERLRFARNLGAMSAGSGQTESGKENFNSQSAANDLDDQPHQQHSARWAALRTHILSQQSV